MSRHLPQLIKQIPKLAELVSTSATTLKGQAAYGVATLLARFGARTDRQAAKVLAGEVQKFDPFHDVGPKFAGNAKSVTNSAKNNADMSDIQRPPSERPEALPTPRQPLVEPNGPPPRADSVQMFGAGDQIFGIKFVKTLRGATDVWVHSDGKEFWIKELGRWRQLSRQGVLDHVRQMGSLHTGLVAGAEAITLP